MDPHPPENGEREVFGIRGDNMEGRLDHQPDNSKFKSQLYYLPCAHGQDVLCRGGNDTYMADLLGMLNEVTYVPHWNDA